MAKLTLVSSIAKPAKSKEESAQSPRDLRAMSPDEQKAFILEAHDALLSFQIPEEDFTVESALKYFSENKPDPNVREAWLKKWLGLLKVEVTIPDKQLTRMAEYAAHLAATKHAVNIGEEEPYEGLYVIQMLPVGPSVIDSSIQGESPYPIGYVYGYPTKTVDSKHYKQLLPYYDVLAGPTWFGRGVFPLYNKSYRHLIDIDAVISNYSPTWLNKQLGREIDRKDAKKLKAKAETAPQAATSEAHAAILNFNLGTKTIREAIILVRDELIKRNSDLESIPFSGKDGIQWWWSILDDRGIEVQLDKEYSAIVVDPTKLCKGVAGEELKVYKKMLGNTAAEAKKVLFKLYC